MKSNFLRWLAIMLILETGLLHLMTAQVEYEEAVYVGYLFAANFFGALAAAFGIHHKQFWGWALGFVIAAGSVAGYTWSRTLGMPGMEVEEWFTPYGVLSLSIESAFILLFIFRPWKMSAGDPHLIHPTFTYSLMIAGIFWLAGISTVAYRWDAAVIRAYGMHVVSLEQALETPEISLAKLEEEYGVQVSLVANSMMGSIVDVRLKIMDPDKAHVLLQNQAALLLNRETLILAPHMHSHSTGRLKTGKMFVIFFPAGEIIHPGSEVSLVFGPIRLAPVVVR
jgi:hypothetical protein